jgi:hypothetical protein
MYVCDLLITNIYIYIYIYIYMIYDWYSSTNINIVRVIKSRRMRWAGHVERMDEKSDVYRILVGKCEGMRPLGGSMRRWEDNIEVDLQEVGCRCVDWIELAQIRDRWRALVNYHLF